MNKVSTILWVGVFFSLTALQAAELRLSPTHAPANIELRDQFDAPCRLSFPGTNIVVLSIADKKGSEQIDAWIAPMKQRYLSRLDIRGMADAGGAPGFVQGKIRKKFQETRQYPVMMDWSGKVCAQFGCVHGLANIVVIGLDGRIHGHFTGPASQTNLAAAFALLDGVLTSRTNSSLNLSPPKLNAPDPKP